MRKLALITALTILSLVTIYFGWAHQRTTDRFFWRTMENGDEYPKLFPYPDAYLIALNEWYEQRYPAPDGVIKLRSEWLRVRQTMFRYTLASGASLAVVAILALTRSIRRKVSTRNFVTGSDV